MSKQIYSLESGTRWYADPVLHRSEIQFRRLLEKLPAGAYTCDPDGLITYYNQQAVGFWGRTPQLNDPTDRFCGSFRLYSANDGTPVTHDECWMALALKNNTAYDGHEIIVERPNGVRLTALAFASPVHDEEGKLLGAVNVLVDITERKRQEKALLEADKAKNDFIATLAHELRNPLAPIQNAVQLLRGGDLAKEDSEWIVEVIDRQSRHLNRLVDDLVDLARITANKIELRTTVIGLREVLESAAEASRPHFENGGHKFTMSIQEKPLLLNGDRTRLAQVITNLLNNAAKFTPQGGTITLDARAENGEARICVRDTGIGISAEAAERVFEMFAQGDSKTHQGGGLGIGLTLARKIVELHCGKISLFSAGPDKGSEFVVKLPLVSQIPDDSELPRRRGPQVPTSRPLRILVADDNRDILTSLSLLLRRAGHEVFTACNGSEAVLRAGEALPDLILMDIGMPCLDGHEAARVIRSSTWGTSMKIIAMTGWGQDEDRAKSKAAGMDYHMVKPLDHAKLFELLEETATTTDRVKE